MATRGKTTQRGYGWRYQQARAALLKDNPPCHWCGAPATTADHVPSIEEVGHPHLNLVPACARCNFGRNGKDSPRVRASRAW